MLVGYARVSSSEQETTLQIDALERYSVRVIYREKGSGVGPRPELQRLLASLVEGDTLVVWKLDRIARSMVEVMRVMDLLKQRRCNFKSLTEPIDTSHSFGELTLQMIAAFAQFERSLIRERAIAGQVAAWQRGVRWGGQPRVVTDEDARELVRMKETGLFTIAMLAEMFDCSESTVWRTYWIARKPSAGKLRKRGAPVLSQYL